jgi:TPR repeat protein
MQSWICRSHAGSPPSDEEIRDKLARTRAFQAQDRYEEAYAAIESLIAHDVREALTLAGTLFYVGVGVETDGQRAVELLTRAAALGDGLAAHNLGTLFATGAKGVDPDAERCRHYYDLAKKPGCDLFR